MRSTKEKRKTLNFWGGPDFLVLNWSQQVWGDQSLFTIKKYLDIWWTQVIIRLLNSQLSSPPHAGADPDLLDALAKMNFQVPGAEQKQLENHVANAGIGLVDTLTMVIFCYATSLHVAPLVYRTPWNRGTSPQLSGMLATASASSKRILRKICTGVTWSTEKLVGAGSVGIYHGDKHPTHLSMNNLTWINSWMSIGTLQFKIIFQKVGPLKTEATSAADGCRDARELVTDRVNCPLAKEMARWLEGGHPERSFARPVFQTFPNLWETNWCFSNTNSYG